MLPMLIPTRHITLAKPQRKEEEDIPHSAFRIPHSAVRIPHSVFRTPHSAFRSPHSAITLAKPQWEEEEDVLVDDGTGSDVPSYIIVFNDHVNSFDWVIESFISVLRHSHEQAEQLSIIIHTKGKATVKTGTREELLPLCEGLLDRGLTAELESE